jgi:hypothetical protein
VDSHLAAIDPLRRQSHGPELEQKLRRLHVNTSRNIVAGRNVTAGYVRAWGLYSPDGIAPAIRQDPIYKESIELARDLTVVDEHKLMNLFLVMKYGLTGIEGDIVEFGSYKGGSAVFMANVARRLGMSAKVYALDTFEGMPETDAARDLHIPGDFNDTSIEALRAFAEEHQLGNLIPVQGLFEDTAPGLLEKLDAVTLAHVDCDIYSAVKYAVDIVRPKMHASGGYIAFDDPLQATCLGALEAVEDMVEATGLRAEQAYPHLVYRFPEPPVSGAEKAVQETWDASNFKRGALAHARVRINTLESEVHDKDEKLLAANQQLEVLNRQLRDKEEQLLARDETAAQLQRRLSELLASTSWRLTAPLRALKRGLSGR